MSLSNSDIINFYKKNNFYEDKNLKTIQFDNNEKEFINFLLDKFVYNSESGLCFLDKNLPISIPLIIDYL